MSKRRIPTGEQNTIYYRPRGPQAPPPVHLPLPARRQGRKWPAILLGFLVIFAFAASVMGVSLYFYQKDRILPGVQTLGVPLGGLSTEAAESRLNADWEAQRIVLSTEDDRIYSVSPASLGLMLDAEATARRAYRQGRGLDQIDTAIQNALGSGGFQPVWYFDPAIARQRLQSIAGQLDVEAVDAGIEIVGGEVRATEARPGKKVDIDANLSWLQQHAAQVVTERRFPLQTRPVQPQVTDVSAAVSELNAQLSHPVSIQAFDPVRGEQQEMTLPAAVWGQWLTLEDNPEKPGQVSWHVDIAQVAVYLQEVNTSFADERYFQVEESAQALAQVIEAGNESVTLRVYHHPKQHTVQAGESLSSIAIDYGIPYPWIQEANPAIGDGLRPGQTITIPSADAMLPLPVVRNKRIVVSLAQQQMWVLENGQEKWNWPVSTGIDSSPTAPGVFQVQTHEPNAYASIWDLWMPNFMGIYRPVPSSDFMNGFHGFPTRNGSTLLWTNSLGHRVTYGCILVSDANIALLYDWAEDGVVVEVRR